MPTAAGTALTIKGKSVAEALGLTDNKAVGFISVAKIEGQRRPPRH